jgi:hypothetical protein
MGLIVFVLFLIVLVNLLLILLINGYLSLPILLSLPLLLHIPGHGSPDMVPPLHILGHGSPGMFRLGRGLLDRVDGSS